ncbi:YqjK-like family protein [Propionivibrio limicola]|uniref:YqjK-like family protein n=1 Tax=Propionivibrio limicola TaxID=167645 RepID=UPI00129239AB|nr:YqjK-like family protein [Propionivibrio limicola]
MNRRLDEILVKRGRLLERIAAQRAELGRQSQPVVMALSRVDRAVGRIRSGVSFVKSHPAWVAIAMTALIAFRPSRLWRWTRRGFSVWQIWRTVRSRFMSVGLSLL